MGGMCLLAEPGPSGRDSRQGNTPGARLVGRRLEGGPASGPHSTSPGPESPYVSKTAISLFLSSLPWLRVPLAVCSL